jgi:general secretion pathway protein D
MRPTILRDQHDVQAAAEGRYARLRDADAEAVPRTLLHEPEVQTLPLEIQGLY